MSPGRTQNSGRPLLCLVDLETFLVRYRVYCYEERYTNGFVFIEAESPEEAKVKFLEMYREDPHSIRENAGEWGGCGDSWNIYFDFAEEDPEPTVSDKLWS